MQASDSMRLRDAVEKWRKKFEAVGIESAGLDARVLALHAAGCEYADLIADPEFAMSEGQVGELNRLAEQRLLSKPIAHLVGWKEFWSLPFYVSDATLIPRPDSETLIEAALDCVEDREGHFQVLDLGTGSGCLLLALLSELPNAVGIGVDRSAAALRVAARNADALGLSQRSHFVQGDWSGPVSGSFDLVLCNPPYIPDEDKQGLSVEVRDFEPESALFGGADGLDPLRALAPFLKGLLSPKGFYIMEFGLGQADSVARVLGEVGLEIVEICKDLAQIERAIVAKAA